MNKRLLYVLAAIIASIFVGFVIFYFTQDRKFAVAYATFSYSMLITMLFLTFDKTPNQ
jgi:hypothetical protein